MEAIQVHGFLLVLCINLVQGNNFTQLDTHDNSSCVQAIPPVNASAKNAFCIYYNYDIRGFCNDTITNLYVFGDSGTLRYGEYWTSTLESYFKIFKISDECRPLIKDFYCRYHFPPCDISMDKPRARTICRRTYEYLDKEVCEKEMIFVKNAAKNAPVFDQDIINGSLYDDANGGDAPECYQYYPISGE